MGQSGRRRGAPHVQHRLRPLGGGNGEQNASGAEAVSAGVGIERGPRMDELPLTTLSYGPTLRLCG